MSTIRYLRGTPDIIADVTIEHGKTDAFESAEEGNPDLYATRADFSTRPEGINPGSLSFEINGLTITGAGEIFDASGLLIPFGESRQFTFTTSCS